MGVLANISDFFLYSCCSHGFSSSSLSSLRASFIKYKKRFTNKNEFANYWSAEGKKLIIVSIWVICNFVLFCEAFIRYFIQLQPSATDAPPRPLVPFYVATARGFGQLLNFNCALLILPTMRTLLNVLYSLKFGTIIPLDKNLVFHRFLAYWIVICTIGHTLGHYLNYSCCFWVYGATSTLEACWGLKYGLTGNLLVMTMFIIYAASAKNYRRTKNFTIFWYAHHFFVIFFILLLIHGKQFWAWFFIPAGLYAIERILRNIRGNEMTIVKRVHCLPSRVIHLELEKQNFRYESGQYCFVNCPLISQHEWHPFTISSAPEEEFLQFHIRCVGDWTNTLMEVFNPKQTQTVEINKPTTPDGKDYLIRIDGPFGTCAEYVYEFEHVMLIAAGIGVTPYSSLLKHFKYRLDATSAHQAPPLKIKRVSFYWINRDEGSWEWFSSILSQLEDENPDFFDIHTYMTGVMKAEDVKKIIFSSEEYTTTNKDAKVEIMMRVLYDYEPQSSDEIKLSRNDIIVVQDQDESGWWTGTNTATGLTGLFPSNFVVKVDHVTKMKDSRKRNFGRPNWDAEFSDIRNHVEKNSPLISQGKKPKVGKY
ncbi:hypothetical protein ABK040_001626 [Willaertia magna]